MARLSLILLGGFRARLDRGQTLSIAIKKSQALLAYLALPLGQAHPREKLAALLWGDMREAQARAGLRQTLFTLRKALGTPDPFRLEGETVALDPALVAADVQAFEQGIARGTRQDLEGAVALYQGDLLEGLTLQEPPFEEWMLTERLRLRELATEALAKLLVQQRDAGALEEAVQTGLRLIALDPLQEPVHRALMRIYAQLGRRSAALRQYQLCVAALQRELHADPDQETRALYQEILQRGPATRSTTQPPAGAPVIAGPEPMPQTSALAPESPIVGRDVELGQLRDSLQAALAGRGQLVAVVGEAGIGKSRLVAELVAESARKGARTLLGRCYETEQVLPFGPWINVLRASRLTADPEMLDRLGPVWRAELSRLLPEIAQGAPPVTPTADPVQLFEAIAQLLERVTVAQPVVLVFEDLHWADEMSLRLLAFVGRRLQRWRLLAVAAVREETLPETTLLRHTLDELAEGHHLSRVALGSLSREETLALARTLVPVASVSSIEEQIWSASRGNPFMVVETLRALSERAPAGGPASLPLPERVRDLIAQRLERLGDRSRRLLAVAAVVGRPFEFALLQRAADLGEAEAAEGVEELVRHRILHGTGEGLEFTHDRLREVVHAQLVPARRALLHRRIAEALEAIHSTTLESHALALGAHYRDGEAWGPAVVHLTQAGVQASLRYARGDAVRCYEDALAALAHLPETRQTREQAAELWFNLAHALLSIGQLERCKESLLRAEGLAVSVDDHRRLAQVHGGMTYMLGSVADFDGAIRSGLRAFTIAASLGDLGIQAWSGIGLGRVYFGQGNYRAAIDRLRWVTRALKETPVEERFGRGSLRPSVGCRAWLALCLGVVGDFSEAIAWGTEGVGIAEMTDGPQDRVWAAYCLASVHLERGDAELARPLLERAAPLCVGGRYPIYAPRVLAALGAVHTLLGDPDGALSFFEQATADAQTTKIVYGEPSALIHTGEAHVAAGRLDQAREHAERALDLARGQGARGDQARALHLLGEIAGRGGPAARARAAEHFESALVLATELGMAPLQARAYSSLGEAHRRMGRDEDATRALTAATTMLETMQMRRRLPNVRPLPADDR